VVCIKHKVENKKKKLNCTPSTKRKRIKLHILKISPGFAIQKVLAAQLVTRLPSIQV